MVLPRPLIATGVDRSTAVTDAVYVMFNAVVSTRRRFAAANWSSLVVSRPWAHSWAASCRTRRLTASLHYDMEKARQGRLVSRLHGGRSTSLHCRNSKGDNLSSVADLRENGDLRPNPVKLDVRHVKDLAAATRLDWT
jgi:hypothetical protein